MTVISMWAVSAQTRNLVILSHGDLLTFFDNVTALEDAIEIAVDGDIIYLGEGKFGVSKQLLVIENKKISIVGCGYKSHIIPIIEIRLDGEDRILSKPLFEGVRLKLIKFSTDQYAYPIKNVEIKKCYIDSFNLSEFGDGNFVRGILLDRCYIGEYSVDGGGYNRVHICNSKIKKFKGEFHDSVENCNIGEIEGGSPSYISNSIINRFSKYSNPTDRESIYENCLIGRISGEGSDKLLNCYDMPDNVQDLLDENLECIIEDMTPYLGTDGTMIGIYGGQWLPFTDTPIVYSVDLNNEDSLLNVKITVTDDLIMSNKIKN